MKKLLLLPTLAMTVLFAGPAQAGESAPMAPAPPPAPEAYGAGFYGAIMLGGNIWQEGRGGDRRFTNDFGDTLTIQPNTDAGFFGGIKLGYVFGTGTVRFALEEDMFYNGWSRGGDSRIVLANGLVSRTSTSSINIDSGVFLTNGILKFGNGKFQPYIGAGIGGYFAETGGVEVTGFRNNGGGAFRTNGDGNASGFAWQAFVGADYYFNPKTSIFLEYKFLQYTKYSEFFDDSAEFNQQLIGAGLRWHF
jgi:opacity protein-like surface antigen